MIDVQGTQKFKAKWHSELEEAYADMIALATASEAERRVAQNRIDNLIQEIEILEQEIIELLTLADSFSDDGESLFSQAMGSYLKRLQQKRVSQLISDISKHYDKTLKLVETVTLKRDDIRELEIQSRSTNDEFEKNEIAQQAKSLQNVYIDEYSRSLRERESLWKKRDSLLNLARMVDKEIPLEILKICDLTPIDWDTATSADGLPIEEYLIPSDNNWSGRGERFVIAGVPCLRGIFAHADSKLPFTIPEGANRFTSVGGINLSDKLPDGSFRRNNPFDRYWTNGKLDLSGLV